MKVSLSWLSQYVDISLSPQELAHKLTMAGLEVEGVEDRYAWLDTVVAGRVTQAEPHPDADRLFVCQVDVGEKILQVICGAPNTREGMVSAVAMAGTVMPGGAKVSDGVIRGVVSEAMLCSEAELALGPDAAGIMDLSGDPAPGASLASHLGLSDTVLEIGITPNRPDCLSMIGVAREVAALCGTTLRLPEISLPEGEGDINAVTSVAIESPEACPRYAARVIEGISIGPSPHWLKDRLLSVGLRPINNVVDVTNFVMMELGQPLHAFDFDLLDERRIVVRLAGEGEKFQTLDSQEKTLTADDLMICDGKKPVALAGVMGGLNSEINNETKNVLIESAFFSPMNVRKTAKRHGYHTDASHRFERGVDPLGQVRAADRAAMLMLETGGGRLIKGVADAHPKPPEIRPVTLSAARCNLLLGTDLSRDEMVAMLQSVELPAQPADGDGISVLPPSFRMDIFRPEDLAEEVARLFGYDNIPVTSPLLPMEAPPKKPEAAFRERLRSLMAGLGFAEAVNYSFVSARSPEILGFAGDDPRSRTVAVANPLTEDLAVMRTSLLPGLLLAAGRNLNLKNRNLRLFEQGKVFWERAGEPLPREVQMLGAVLAGNRRPRSWREKEAPCDFFDAKGAAEALLSALMIKGARFEAADAKEAPYLKPGYCARVVLGETLLGSLGEVREEVRKAFDIKEPVFVIEFNAADLYQALPGTVAFTPPPRFPEVVRDITLIVDKAVRGAEVLDRIEGMEHSLVESAAVYDVYEGEPVPSGKRSLTFRITYRSLEATLTDEEVNALHENIGRALAEALPG